MIRALPHWKTKYTDNDPFIDLYNKEFLDLCSEEDNLESQDIGFMQGYVSA